MESTHQLPTFSSLQQANEEQGDKFLALVNKPCPQDWLKSHPQIKVKNSQGQYVALKYLPIDKVEFLLTRVFGAFYQVEVLRESVMFNSVAVTARIHYCIPGTSTWLYKDGCGAAPVQTDKGESAANLAAIKPDGVQKAFPSALSYAVSNAAARIGKVFGADINKDDAFEYAGTYSQAQAPAEQAQPQFYAPQAAPQQPAAPAAPQYPAAAPAQQYPAAAPQPQTPVQQYQPQSPQPSTFTPQFNFTL